MSPRYWSDDSYAQFYQSSTAERGLVKKGGGGEEGGADGAGLWRPDRVQLETFQRAFAEWSGGRGGLRLQDFRPFLNQVGVELSAQQARTIWRDKAPAAAESLGYDGALLLYREIMNAPLRIQPPPGAAPSGRVAPHGAELAEEVGAGVVQSAAAGAEDCEAEARRRHQQTARRAPEAAPPLRSLGGGFGSGPPAAGTGLRLPLGEARELLLDEGLPAAAVEALLRRFGEEGMVPQAAIFDFLEKQAGALDEDEPVCSKPSERKQAARPPAAPPVAPLLC